eukprot:jgi/Botrbrau1/15394/Bobra.43_2s0022.1
MGAAAKLRVDIVSDTVCPWCYVGKRRLEKAIQQVKGQREVEVWWHPFQLNPGAPQEGINKLEYYKSKFGEAATRSMLPRMAETFKQEGIQEYSMDGLTGNTFNSHRLIAFAGQQGSAVQNRLVEELFKAHFTQGKYINDPAVLLEAAKAAGVEGAQQVLEDPSVAKEEVENDLKTLARGVSGVPYFIIDGKYALSGAQDPASFVSAFNNLENGGAA